MKILIVDGFQRHEHGRRAWQSFERAVRAALAPIATADAGKAPIVECVPIGELGAGPRAHACDTDLGFDGAYSDPAAGARFDATDLIFVDGDAGLLPWEPTARPLLALVKACVACRKALFAAGPAALMVGYVCATGGRRLRVLNGDAGGGGPLAALRRTKPPPPAVSAAGAAAALEDERKEETGGGRGAGAASTAPHRRAALAAFVDCDSGDYFVFAHGATGAPRAASADITAGGGIWQARAVPVRRSGCRTPAGGGIWQASTVPVCCRGCHMPDRWVASRYQRARRCKRASSLAAKRQRRRAAVRPRGARRGGANGREARAAGYRRAALVCRALRARHGAGRARMREARRGARGRAPVGAAARGIPRAELARDRRAARLGVGAR